MKVNHLVKHSCLVLLFVLSLVLMTIPAANASHVNPNVIASEISNHNSSNSNSKFARTYKIAKSKLGHRYVYGAMGPNHFDCSGFTKYIYKHGAHVSLPRTAQAQYNSFAHANHARQGELVFFGASKRSISHVGMCINNTKMIDAQNRGVVVENIHAPWWHQVGYSQPLAN